MRTAKGIGRIIGVLILMQMIGSGLVNFVLLEPVFSAPGFLVNAAGHSLRVSLSVLLGLATGLLPIGIAIAAWQVFRRYSHAMALWFVALSVVSFTLAAIENIDVMSLLSLSEAYTQANVADRVLFQALRGVVASTRNWTHYVGLVVAGCTLLVFYSTLIRFALVPRILAAFGLGAVMLEDSRSSLRALLGQSIVFPMLLPLGLSQTALALWLIARGLPLISNLGPRIAATDDYRIAN